MVATSEQQPNPLRCRPQSRLVLIIIIIMVMVTMLMVIMVMVTMVIISCPQQLNRTPCPLVGLSVTTNNQSLHNTTE